MKNFKHTYVDIKETRTYEILKKKIKAAKEAMDLRTVEEAVKD